MAADEIINGGGFNTGTCSIPGPTYKGSTECNRDQCWAYPVGYIKPDSNGGKWGSGRFMVVSYLQL